jgi:hypothetical protein
MPEYASVIHGQHGLPTAFGVVLTDHVWQVDIGLNVMVAVDFSK